MTVYLVGAGPGDPGLLTVRGARVLATADVVVHDRLAEASLLDLAPTAAERIDVGKSPGGPVHQDEINALLVERGRAGQQVVRLKGGDPFVFGRGGEEAAALLAAGVPFEVVPGISAAVGVPAYAGIPVTHRGLSTSFTVVTGHSRHAVDDDIDWEALARIGDTVVVLMGVAHRAEIAARLMRGGAPASTPVAAIRWGTRPDQRTVRTTLGELHACPLEPPVTMVIGQVAALDLPWFESRPLFGRRVVVTRARHQASGLGERLRAVGAEPVEVPTIEIADPDDGGRALRTAAAHVRDYDWVCFTSPNAVERFLACVRDARALGGVQVAAIGPGTAAALAAAGIVADLVPDRSLAEGLVDAFPPAADARPGEPVTLQPPRGGQSVTSSGAAAGPGPSPSPVPGARRVLLPQAAGARPVLADGLAAKGWTVDVAHAYRTVPVTPPPDLLATAAKADAIAFTSASTVTAFLAAAGGAAVPPVVVCIGPVTAAAAEAEGLTVDVTAADHTLDGLVAALVAALGRRPAEG
ncbi:MAG: uroporphyrinogen methyltransferase / synthase [Actinomycetota bacterium]|nr:uroporphyrinogen methyltransferase / synthase [Actinomycetota bacterium]